jgi:hypothetical protein
MSVANVEANAILGRSTPLLAALRMVVTDSTDALRRFVVLSFRAHLRRVGEEVIDNARRTPISASSVSESTN